MRVEQIGNATLINADCRVAMQAMDENSVDAIVCDPPYGLSFMGKGWDHGVPGKEFWEAALRVAKPGAYVLAFGGTRTFHRLACAIEDAGWEIRDTIGWMYSTGFPKSLNLDREKGKIFCNCEEQSLSYIHEQSESSPERNLRPVQHPDVSSPLDTSEGGGRVLQSGVQEQGTSAYRHSHGSTANDGYGEPCLEGRNYTSPSERELRSGAVRASAGLGQADGAQGRVCDGTPTDNGGVVRKIIDSNRNSTPRQSQAIGERQSEPRIVAGQSQPQNVGAWPTCGGCGKPRIPSGLGTALKPAWEPIILARKPPIGTVAANVQQFGTGGLNIDGCRVETVEAGGRPLREVHALRDDVEYAGNSIAGRLDGSLQSSKAIGETNLGRWPANLIHDGSEEVLACFPDSNGSGPARVLKRSAKPEQDGWGMNKNEPDDAILVDAGTGSAARFFYCAKASKADRDEGCDHLALTVADTQHKIPRSELDDPRRAGTVPRKNSHPTVKPTELMRYLCRLVTPPGGTVLDPFMGSGSTGKAALKEGFNFIGVELDEEHGYFDIACARVRSAVE